MNAETLAMATLIAGLIGVPVVQGVKQIYKMMGTTLEGKTALAVTVGVSFILGVVVLWLTGAFTKPISIEMVGGVILSIFAIATVIYKSILSGSPADPLPAASSDQSGRTYDPKQ